MAYPCGGVANRIRSLRRGVVQGPIWLELLLLLLLELFVLLLPLLLLPHRLLTTLHLYRLVLLHRRLLLLRQGRRALPRQHGPHALADARVGRPRTQRPLSCPDGSFLLIGRRCVPDLTNM